MRGWISQADIEQRISEIRQEAAPAFCPVCGSSAPPTRQRRCYRCSTTQPITEFVANRSQPFGHGYICRPCHNAVRAVQRREQRRKIVRQIVRRAT